MSFLEVVLGNLVFLSKVPSRLKIKRITSLVF